LAAAREGSWHRRYALREAEFVDQLLLQTDIVLQGKKGGVLCTLNNQDFSHTQWVELSQSEIRGKSEKQIERDALQKVARMFLVHLSSDVNAARKLGGAFGSSIPIFQKLLANRGEKISNVAFQVELPALDGLSTAQLIDNSSEVRGHVCSVQKTFAVLPRRMYPSGNHKTRGHTRQTQSRSD
jgi:hypothetical protein